MKIIQTLHLYVYPCSHFCPIEGIKYLLIWAIVPLLSACTLLSSPISYFSFMLFSKSLSSLHWLPTPLPQKIVTHITSVHHVQLPTYWQTNMRQSHQTSWPLNGKITSTDSEPGISAEHAAAIFTMANHGLSKNIRTEHRSQIWCFIIFSSSITLSSTRNALFMCHLKNVQTHWGMPKTRAWGILSMLAWPKPLIVVHRICSEDV
jgi:hypothetical protein